MNPTIFLIAYVGLGFLVSSIATRFGFFNDADNTPDAIFGFLLVWIFWPLAMLCGVLYLPGIAFYNYVEYLHGLGKGK